MLSFSDTNGVAKQACRSDRCCVRSADGKIGPVLVPDQCKIVRLCARAVVGWRSRVPMFVFKPIVDC